LLGFAKGEDPAIVITPDEAELTVGQSQQFQAVYIDTAGVEHDTSFTWAVSADSLGTIDTTGLFVAALPGECAVTATLDTLVGWAMVTIEAEEEDTSGHEYEFQHLVILPRDTVVALGAEIQFQAYQPDSTDFPGEPMDTTLTWTLAGMPVGDLSEDGLLTATATGYGVVRAQLDEWEGSAFIVVVDSSADPTGLNEITITRDSPSKKGYTTMSVLNEGELWTIGGLPHPMNILNGGNVYFPVGCLTQDIRIHISLPGFTKVQGDTVGFTHEGVISGIDFQVMVDDIVSEPYDFETPLIVGLVFKRGLLKNLDIDPATLGLYFATVDGDTVAFDTTGIGYTTVDLALNRIFSTVAHFSSLAIVGEVGSAEPLGADANGRNLPNGYALHANFPNPFNPSTTIRFDLPTAAPVSLVVYDLLGRQVIRLVDGYRPAGTAVAIWNGRDGDGREVPTGVYIARLTAPGFSRAIKMLLLK
ncbi:MAG: Ig-like domain-containing protein, partial [Fidelibacterota bacterium]